MKKFIFSILLLLPSAVFAVTPIGPSVTLRNTYLNVKDYGAKGDGSTVDTSSIQYANNTCSSLNATLYFPPGIYISTQIYASSSCTWLGAGSGASIISLPQSNQNPFNYSLIQTSVPITNLHFDKLGFRGNRPFQTTAITTVYGGWAMKFSTGPFTNISIDQCDISFFGDLNQTLAGGGIWMGAEVVGSSNSAMSNIRITNSHFGQSSGSEVYIAPGYGHVGTLDGLFVTGNDFETGVNSFHQNIVYVLGGTYYNFQHGNAYNVHVDENIFTLTGDIDGFIEYDGVNGGTVNNNTMRSTTAGLGHCLYLASTDQSGGSIDLNGVTVDGNTFINENATDKTCIVLQDIIGHHNLHRNIVLSNNTFYGYGFQNPVISAADSGEIIDIHDNEIGISTTAQIGTAIQITSGNGMSIHDNWITRAQRGIRMATSDHPQRNNSIYDNHFSSCGYVGGSIIETFAGTLDSQNLRIQRNEVFKSSAGANAFISITVSTNAGNFLTDNIIDDGLTLTDTPGAFTLISNNQVSSSTSSLDTSTRTYTGQVTFQNGISLNPKTLPAIVPATTIAWSTNTLAVDASNALFLSTGSTAAKQWVQLITSTQTATFVTYSSASLSYVGISSLTTTNGVLTLSSASVSYLGISSTPWTNVSASTITTLNTNKITSGGANAITLGSGGVGILGTNTNDNASAGNYGFYATSFSASPGFTCSNNAFIDIATVTLSAGDYDITGIVDFSGSGITGTEYVGGIGTTGGNSSAGMSFGDTMVETPTSPTSAATSDVVIPGVRKSFGTSTTVYLKAYALFSAGTLKAFGRISYREAR